MKFLVQFMRWRVICALSQLLVTLSDCRYLVRWISYTWMSWEDSAFEIKGLSSFVRSLASVRPCLYS